MLRNTGFIFKTCASFSRKLSTTQANKNRVCVIGASGAIGQALSLLLKRDTRVTALSLYDIKKAVGIALDMSDIDTNSLIGGHEELEMLPKALYCADVVVIVAGQPRKKGMTDDELLKKNADVIIQTMPHIAETCPKALIAIVTSPVDSLVPLAAEVLKTKNAYDPNRLFGVTTHNAVRARTYISDVLQVDASSVKVPVIGGNSKCTILPILTHTKPILKIEDEDDALPIIKKVRDAEETVAKTKGAPPTLVMAHSVAKFTHSLILGLAGLGDPVECAYVESTVTDCAFFATPLKLGKNGIEKNLGIPSPLAKFEAEMLQELMPELKESIKKGLEYAKKVDKGENKREKSEKSEKSEKK
ncbi:malate dehydrogenase, mitochondrial [Ceratitis capitata]|uniref:Malate dehydrogenase, mitochondrial n=1 Tax=Ceratitis capitata TaxID=7213 RepID=W8C563_CERCA|nr:malate dehydrogenase, mitochondrial [Ceratitis capitata]